MHAITVWRPWAACFTHLPGRAAKRIENRTWNTTHRGPILLHAGKRFDPSAFTLISRIELALHPRVEWISRDPADHPTGIFAVADLVDVCTRSKLGKACTCNEWAVRGQTHWRLDNFRRLDVIPCNGVQGLWTPSPDIQAQVDTQLATTPTGLYSTPGIPGPQ
jgi:hypothetical protein